MTNPQHTRRCPDCGADISSLHFNAKRCAPCAEVAARAGRAASQRRVRSSPEGQKRLKAARLRYRSKPGVREREAAYMREQRTKPEVREREAAYGREYGRRPEVRARKNAARRADIENKKRFNERDRKRYANDPEYRRRKQGFVGFSCDKNRSAIARRDGTTCKWCGLPLDPMDRQGVHVDHIVPRSKNGPSTLDNLQLLHAACNMKKRSGPMEPPR